MKTKYVHPTISNVAGIIPEKTNRNLRIKRMIMKRGLRREKCLSKVHGLSTYVTVLLLAFFCLTTQAQDEGELYDKALRMMAENRADSALACLDSLASAYGHDDISLYSDLIINEAFRPLHHDERWKSLTAKLLKAKHEVEDTLTLSCLEKAETTKDVTAEAKNYRLNVGIDVKNKTLKVDGDITVNFNGKPFIDFSLWKYSEITDVSAAKARLDYTFDRDIASVWMEQAGRLRVRRDKKDEIDVRIAYTARLDSIDTWMDACDSDFVQLSMYMPWFPYNYDSNHFTADVTLTIDDGFEVTGSGVVSKSDGKWHMRQPWEGFDLEIIAAKRFHKQTVTSNGRTIEIDYLQIPDSDLDSLSFCCRQVFELYKNLYQTEPEAKALKIVLLPDRWGAISRRNFILANVRSYGEFLYRLLAHEIGHFWWQNAPVDSWLDWLNESFAEYSSLRAIQHHYGNAVFEDYINSYRESTLKSCPIYRLDRNAPKAHLAFYQKGALILYDLQKSVGETPFLRFMRKVAACHVSDNDLLLRVASITLGSEWAEWIDRRLRE